MRTVAIIIALTAIIAAAAAADTVAPLGLRNISIGGSDLNAFTRGIDGGIGPNNVGLLVRTWGLVTLVDDTNHLFYVDDGSGAIDYTTIGSGVRVSYDGLATGNTFTPPTAGQYVGITGISSLFSDSSRLLPVVKARKQSDLSILR